MNILFITSTRIGDAVLSSGLLATVLARYPAARLTIACGPAAAPLFEAVPGLERLIVMRKTRYAGHWLRLWRAVVGRRWDLVVDLRGSAIAYLLWAKARRVLPGSHESIHRVRYAARALRLETPPTPRLWTAPRHRDAAARLIPAGRPVLAIGPTANWIGKQWPAENFAALAQALTAPGGILPDARVAVFGAASERDMALPLLQAIAPERLIDLVGAVDLLTAYACLQRSGLYIGNDSGLMHMAAASDIPTLGLFGPSREALYAPWGANSALVRTPESYEQIVGQRGYDRHRPVSYMGSLAVATVVAAAESLWHRRQAADPSAIEA